MRAISGLAAASTDEVREGKRTSSHSRRLGQLLGIALMATTVVVAAPAPARAAATITSTTDALATARAMIADQSILVGAQFLRRPSFASGVLTGGSVSGFPTDGGAAAILTTGDVLSFTDPKSTLASDDNAGASFRGNSDFDVVVLRLDIDVPSTANCLVGMDFRYYSEEFPEFVGTKFNDAFIAEIDGLTWTTSGSQIFAPGNFAFDPVGNPISVNAAGATSMFSGQAAGTVYDGATPLLRAATPITPGRHSIYLTIFDQGDRIFDSAVIIDNLRFDNVDDLARDCQPGATNIDPASESDFIPIQPARLFESRSGAGLTTLDGVDQGAGRRTATSVTEVQIAGRAGVPSDASAAALNVTVVRPGAPGFITVFPCGAPRPLASSMNYRTSTIAGAVLTKIGTDGKVCLYSEQPTDLVVDINGFFPATSTYVSLEPQRLLETRPGKTTVDGASQGLGLRPPGTVTRLRVVGRAGVPNDAKAVTIAVASIRPRDTGFLTVYPCGAIRPLASNLNHQPGQTIANNVVVQIGDGGEVCIYNKAESHVIADISGYFPAGSTFIPLIPARVLETRGGAGNRTVDGLYQGIRAREAGTTTELLVGGRAGVPSAAESVILNVTAVSPGANGFLTVYPCGAARPVASNLNYRRGETIANTVVARIGDGGRVCVYTSARTHVLVDVTG